MTLSIFIKRHHKGIPALREMLIDYNLDGGKIIRLSSDDRMLPFDDQGESELTQEQYASLDLVPDIRFEGGMFFHIFTTKEKDNLVPVPWPDSKDSEGVRIAFENYFRNDEVYPIEQPDGNWLFRIVREGMGLSDADRLIYQNDLCGDVGQAPQFLVKAEGLALFQTSDEGI